MHTLLLRPPPRSAGSKGLRVPPLGLAYLAASLLESQLPVTLLDAQAEDLSWEEAREFVRSLRPNILGLSAMTPTRDVAYRAARLFRPYVDYIVLGGPHPTAVKELALNECSELDFLVLGEGEFTLPALVGALDRGEASKGIPGVITRQWRGGHADAVDPDLLPLPSRHLLPNHRYRYALATGKPVTTMITSRGCPFHCTFCDQSVTGRNWRARSPDLVLDEFKQLHSAGFRYVCIYDDNFTLNRSRVFEICEGLIRNNIRLEWKCEARIDGVDRELLHLMARAGCKTIAFGLETINQVGLETLRKGSTPQQARQALRWSREAGIETMAYVLVGIPGESPPDARRTLRFCLEEGIDYVQFSTLSAIPGTELYAEAIANEWLTGASVKGPFDADLHRSTIIPPGWSAESLKRMVEEAYRAFYFRPSFMLRFGARSLKAGFLPMHLGEAASLLSRRHS